MFVHDFGRAPDFIDGHQHVHLFPQVRDALLEVAKEHGAECLGAPMRARRRRSPPRLGDRKGFVLDVLSKRFRERAAALGVRTNPAFAGTYDVQRERRFRGAVSALPRAAAGRRRWSCAIPASSMPSCGGSTR